MIEVCRARFMRRTTVSLLTSCILELGAGRNLSIKTNQSLWRLWSSTPAVDVVDKWLEHARYTALWCVQGHIKMPFFRQASFRSEYDSRIYHFYVHKCSLIYHLVPFRFLQIVQILRITIHSIEILFADYALST